MRHCSIRGPVWARFASVTVCVCLLSILDEFCVYLLSRQPLYYYHSKNSFGTLVSFQPRIVGNWTSSPVQSFFLGLPHVLVNENVCIPLTLFLVNVFFYLIFLEGVVESLDYFYTVCNPVGVTTFCLSAPTSHICSHKADRGWGCGYRNVQMGISSLLHSDPYTSILGKNGECSSRWNSLD